MQSVVSGITNQCCGATGAAPAASVNGMSYGSPVSTGTPVDPNYQNYSHGAWPAQNSTDNAQEVIGEAVSEAEGEASALDKAKEAVEALEDAVN